MKQKIYNCVLDGMMFLCAAVVAGCSGVEPATIRDAAPRIYWQHIEAWKAPNGRIKMKSVEDARMEIVIRSEHPAYRPQWMY